MPNRPSSLRNCPAEMACTKFGRPQRPPPTALLFHFVVSSPSVLHRALIFCKRIHHAPCAQLPRTSQVAFNLTNLISACDVSSESRSADLRNPNVQPQPDRPNQKAS